METLVDSYDRLIEYEKILKMTLEKVGKEDREVIEQGVYELNQSFEWKKPSIDGFMS